MTEENKDSKTGGRFRVPVGLGLKGAGIGIANVIPGVSGGTIALIMGIYHELAEAVGNIFTASWKKRWEYAKLLIPLFIGAGISILLFARLVEWLYQRYPEPLGFFFLGLIAASLPALMQEMKKKQESVQLPHWLLFFAGFSLTLALGIMDRYMPRPELEVGVLPVLSSLYGLKLFISGLLAASSMVIPGISGSFVMLLLGEYYHILGFINALAIAPLLIFGVGTAAGLVAAAKLIDLLLKRFFRGTMMVILGLVLASLYVVWPGLTLSPLPLITDLCALGIGGWIVLQFATIR